MGDPRKIKNKYSGPMHPWNKQRIDEEKPLMKTYGLVNKTELWKVESKLKKFKDNAKKLVAIKGAQAEKERAQIMDKMRSLNLIQSDLLDDVLGMRIEQLLDRRLQTLAFKKGLARSIKQARQMITHGHIRVNGKKTSAPGYLVPLKEEASIEFINNSSFSDPEHPERKPAETQKEQELIKKVSKKTKSSKEEKSEEVPEKVEAKKAEPEVVEETKTEEASEE